MAKQFLGQQKPRANTKMSLNPIDWLRSQAGGGAYNMVGSYLDNRYFDKHTQPQIDRLNNAGQGALNRAGFNTDHGDFQGRAIQLGERGMRLADQGFSDDAVQGRFRDSFGGIQRGLTQLPRRIQSQQQGALSGYENTTGNIANQFDSGANALLGQWGGIADNARGLAGNLYGQARADVMQNSQDEIAANNQMLAERGFGGSTIQSGLTGSTNQRRDTELRRLTADEAQTRLGVEQTFGLGGVNAGFGALQGGTNLRSGFAGNQLEGGLGAAGLNASTGLNSFSQQGNLGTIGFDARNQALMNRLGAYSDFGKYGIQVGQDTLNAGLGYYGPPIVTQRPGFQPATVQPYGGSR